MNTETVFTFAGQLGETLALMRRLIEEWSIHPAFVMLARRIVAHATGPEHEARAIYEWVRARVQYRRDPVGAEWVQDPMETLWRSRAGDCDDMAVAAGALLQAIGHPVQIQAIRWEGRKAPSHVVVFDQAANLVVDPVSPSFPWPPAGFKVAATVSA